MSIIHISPSDDIQAIIDASKIGDTIVFTGTFFLKSRFTAWTNRTYDGNGSIFHIEDGLLQTQSRAGEPNDSMPRWLCRRPWNWLP